MDKKEVIIIGGGASIEEGIKTDLWEKIRGKEVWSLNFAFRAMPYLPTRELWVDTTFYRNNIADLERIHKLGVACHTRKNDRYNGIPDIIQHETTRNIQEKDKKIYLCPMGLCGMFALGVAVQEKYEQIYLLGYDFGTNSLGNTHTHFYQDTKMDYQSSGVGRPSVYLQSNNHPKRDANEFGLYAERGGIWNVSVNSHIIAYPRISYEEFYGKTSQT